MGGTSVGWEGGREGQGDPALAGPCNVHIVIAMSHCPAQVLAGREGQLGGPGVGWAKGGWRCNIVACCLVQVYDGWDVQGDPVLARPRGPQVREVM